MQTIYREKRYICGDYMDLYIYPTYRQTKSRSKKSQPTSEVQMKLNDRHAAERLTRLMHGNFTSADLEEHLTYSVQPLSDKEAKRDIQNFIRRVKAFRKKQGLPELKYIYVTEKSKSGRYHHHVTISGGVDRDKLESLWTLGYANTRRLQFTETGLESLSRYIIKDPIFYRRWNGSKNLVDPEPKVRDGKISGRQAKELARDISNRDLYASLYPGYILARAEEFHNDINGGQYIRAMFYRADGVFARGQQSRKRSARKKEADNDSIPKRDH